MNGVIIESKKVSVVALVPSESVEGAYYRVALYDDEASCTCPHHTFKGAECKHINKVREMI